MSSWTHIDGTIKVSPYGHTQAQKRYILETVLEHLPRVTGSERDMNVYIVQPKGFDHSSSCDEFGEHTNNLTSFHGHKSYTGSLNMQDVYILTLDADLRDREFEGTKHEFMNWLCRLSKRLFVRDLIVRVRGFERTMIITRESSYEDMYESPSWAQGSSEDPAWWEFMDWDRAKNSDYPLKLAYKYHNDPESDAEMQRRRINGYQ